MLLNPAHNCTEESVIFAMVGSKHLRISCNNQGVTPTDYFEKTLTFKIDKKKVVHGFGDMFRNKLVGYCKPSVGREKHLW